jgi:hypothetical protein
MNLLSRFRKPPTTDTAGEAPAPSGGDDLGITGYDRLSETKVVDELAPRSQEELEAIEAHERSSQGRSKILHKLRWLRGKEPLRGYDTLSVAEISKELATADTRTLKDVRAYERKHQNRREVMDEVARLMPSSKGTAEDERAGEEKAAGIRELIRSRS